MLESQLNREMLTMSSQLSKVGVGLVQQIRGYKYEVAQSLESILECFSVMLVKQVEQAQREATETHRFFSNKLKEAEVLKKTTAQKEQDLA